MGRRVRVLAPAKVNLTLEVLGRRADGYHEIASVMATCDLFDDVRVGPASALDVRVSPPVGADPADDLAGRAVRALAETTGHAPQVHVRVRKRIPVAAGLGGGSSDAGAVLRALAELWGVPADLAATAARIGSDVPFFAIGCPAARVGGRGEQVTALPPSELWIALVTLPARSATAQVYAAVDTGARGDGDATAELARLFQKGSANAAAVRLLLRNDLTTAAESVCPAISDARAAGARAGIDLALSGSGPSLFAVADDGAHAIRVSRALRRAGLRSRPHRLCLTSGIQRA